MSTLLTRYSDVNGKSLANSAELLYNSFNKSIIDEIKEQVSSNLRWKAASKNNLIIAFNEIDSIYIDLKNNFMYMKAIGNKIERYNQIVSEIKELKEEIDDLSTKILFETNLSTKKMYINQRMVKNKLKNSKMNYLFKLSREITAYKNKIK